MEQSQISPHEAATSRHNCQLAVDEACAICTVHPDGNILYVNGAFQKISQYTSAELLGKPFELVQNGCGKPGFLQMWGTLQQGKQWRAEVKNKAKDGSCYWVDCTATPSYDQQGKLQQYLFMQFLITARKEKEESQKEQQLKDAQTVSKTGSWHLTVATGGLQWTEESYKIFEIPPGISINFEAFMSKLHPDDRNRVTKSWRQATQAGNLDIEYRIVTGSGQKWIRGLGRFERSAGNSPVSAHGTMQDITEKRNIENGRRESEELYISLFNSIPLSVALIEKTTLQFLHVNHAAKELYGYSKEEFLNLTLYDIRLQEDHEKLRHQINNGTYIFDTDQRRHRKKNRDILVAEPTIEEIMYKGRPVYLVTVTDVTDKLRLQQERLQAKLARQVAILEGQEASRAEIGRELHDNVNQLLVASILFIKNAKPASDKDRGFIDTGLEIIANANEEIRKLSSDLVSPSLDHVSLKDSIEDLAYKLRMIAISPRLFIRVEEDKLAQNFKINLYRIFQEQLSNIMKHASAANVLLQLLQTETKLQLVIQDDGKGFDPNKKSQGIGLRNIVHRVEAYSGKLEIIAAEGKGCSIKIEFKLPLVT